MKSAQRFHIGRKPSGKNGFSNATRKKKKKKKMKNNNYKALWPRYCSVRRMCHLFGCPFCLQTTNRHNDKSFSIWPLYQTHSIFSASGHRRRHHYRRLVVVGHVIDMAITHLRFALLEIPSFRLRLSFSSHYVYDSYFLVVFSRTD